MLLHLIADLSRQSDLRERFAKNPREVLSEYRVSEQDYAALRDPSGAALHDKLGAELQRVRPALAPSVALPLPWPGASALVLDSVSPEKASANTAFELTILAEQTQQGPALPFPQQATVNLSGGDGNHSFGASVVVDPESAYRARVVASNVKLSQVGDYGVQITAAVAGHNVAIPWTGKPLVVR